jgi:hypothetical protein
MSHYHINAPDVKCPACDKSFDNAGSLSQHLRDQKNATCVVTQNMRPRLIQMGLTECDGCHKWWAKRGITNHKKACGESSPDGAARQRQRPDMAPEAVPPAPPGEHPDEVVDLYSAERMQWLDDLDWDDVGRCPYSTIETPRGAISFYLQTHTVVQSLFNKGEDNRAWKLHFFLIRVLFAPTKPDSGDDKLSATALVKSRCSAFLRGEWRHLWQEASQARVPDDTAVALDRDEAAELQRRLDIRARMFAREGMLSKAMSVFDTAAVLDPRDRNVMQQLEDLQAPATRFEELPEPPAGLDADEDFEYKLGTVEIPTGGGGTAEVPSIEFVKSRLKRGIAQSLSGARYEHYKCLPSDLLELMVTKILNGDTSEGARSIITTCRGFALDKGGRKVRPVQIGEAIRRIAARVVCVQDNQTIAALLTPVMQFGVAVKGGIEYAYHSVRLHMLSAYDDFEQRYYSGDDRSDDDDVPGILKVDYTNGYNSTQRSRMLAQVEVKLPHLLRFARYCYAQVAKVVIMHKGATVRVLDSKFGSQQGDPLGGHFFALSIFDFMLELKDTFQNACVSWIVDDMTASGTQEELVHIAKFIEEKGPAYGLFKNNTKGEFYTPFNAVKEDFTPCRALTVQYKYKHAKHGFEKLLLGAPLGGEDFEAEKALERTQELTQGANHLKRIQDTQLEFVLLKYCICTVIVHLLRMLEPGTMRASISHHEKVVRKQTDRIVMEADRQTELPELTWQWAQQPVREGGLGLQNLQLVAPAAYMASMGAVARRATAIHQRTGSIAAHVVRSWFTQDNEGFERQLAGLAEKVNVGAEGDAPDIICPSLAALEKMPTQHVLSERLYATRRKELLKAEQSDEVRAFRLSNCQFNAGSWLNSIPMLKRFKCSSAVFKVMLQFRLCLFLAFSNGVKECACGEKANVTFKYGWHWTTRCSKAVRILNHNRVRDLICDMYRSLKVDARTEVRGLYAQLTSYGEYKPADVLVPASASSAAKAQALDVAITDPTGKVAVQRLSHRHPLRAAEIRHRDKMSTHRKALTAAGANGLPFTKVPLVFETTGAMGAETQKWWKDIRKMEKDQRGLGETTSRKDLGLDWTFTANGFASYWLQSISMSMARTAAESIIAFIGGNQEAGVSQVHPSINVA